MFRMEYFRFTGLNYYTKYGAQNTISSEIYLSTYLTFLVCVIFFFFTFLTHSQYKLFRKLEILRAVNVKNRHTA